MCTEMCHHDVDLTLIRVNLVQEKKKAIFVSFNIFFIVEKDSFNSIIIIIRHMDNFVGVNPEKLDQDILHVFLWSFPWSEHFHVYFHFLLKHLADQKQMKVVCVHSIFGQKSKEVEL